MTEVAFSEEAAPEEAALNRVLGTHAGLWRELVGRIEEMGGRGAWVWGGTKYGWELKFKRGSRPFATLSPKADRPVALVILGRAEVEAVNPSALGERMRATFEGSRQLPDGRWLFHPIEVERDVVDVAALLVLKLPPTVRARLAGGAPT